MPFRRGHLRYFVTVVEEGQLTRAAKRLEVAQPALSQAIAQLEAEVGVKLLERHARGVTPTDAGRELYEKARLAVAAAADAAQTGESLSRSEHGSIEFGFVGVPPGVDSLQPLEAFASQHPDIEIRYRELPFPTRSTASWLADVDVAVCHTPPSDPRVWAQPVRVEPRVVLAPTRHPLAGREELGVAEVLEQTFIGIGAAVDPGWSGFWNLDDHRGGPPAHMTTDAATNPHEVMAALAVRNAITTVPGSVRLILNRLTGVAAITLSDAEPSRIMLVGHEQRRTPQVEALRSFARSYRG